MHFPARGLPPACRARPHLPPRLRVQRERGHLKRDVRRGRTPLSGIASGTLYIGSFAHDFDWLRVGSHADIMSDANVPPADKSLAGVGAFSPVILPGDPVPTCANPALLTAHVAGAAFHI